MSTMVKPSLNVHQLVSSKNASKKFGEVRKKAQEVPQFVMDNGSVDTVIIGYDLYEEMYDRLTQLEQAEERRILFERIDQIDRNPAASKSWKEIRRES